MALDPRTADIIHSKKLRYCRFADTNQWSRLDDIVLPEATFSFVDSDGSPIQLGGVVYSFSSREEFRAFFSKAFETLQTIHLVGPAELKQTGPDEVKAVWGLIYHAGPKGNVAGGVGHGTGGGHYHEVWRRKGDDWFMQALRMERAYWNLATS